MNDVVYDLTNGWNSLAAELLYACMDNGVPAAELAFYERRIRANGGLALDQACGTGRHIIPLLEHGLQVHGADISDDALAFARKAAREHQLNPTLYHQRMEECSLPWRYGTLYVANGTFQIIVDRKRALSTLRGFLKHLQPGGQLLLEISVPYEDIEDPDSHGENHPTLWEPTPRRDGEGQIRTTLWTESVDLFEQTLVSKRRNELIIDGRVVQSELCAHPMTWYYKHEFQMMLESAGFTDLQTYSDYGDEPATKDSTAVVYAGRRPVG